MIPNPPPDDHDDLDAIRGIGFAIVGSLILFGLVVMAIASCKAVHG